MLIQISALPVLHNAPRQSKWHNRRETHPLGYREDELKKETTTGTTPYASKFPWPILLHKVAGRSISFLSVLNTHICGTPNLRQPATSQPFPLYGSTNATPLNNASNCPSSIQKQESFKQETAKHHAITFRRNPSFLGGQSYVASCWVWDEWAAYTESRSFSRVLSISMRRY